MHTQSVTALTGLSTEQVTAARQQYGANEITTAESQTGWLLVKEVVTEPMFMLLAAASLIYVLLGEWQEGITLAVAMVLVAGISVYQTVRSDQALKALRKLTEPTISVVRNGELITVGIEEVVVGDLIWITEGQTAPADGLLVQANDCSIDESVLTGESVPVVKSVPDKDPVYAGTILVSGSAYVRVTAVGDSTSLGKLGRSLQGVEVEKTPLQRQIGQFVQRMAYAGFGAFLLVWGINFAQSGEWATSLLLGLTIAMSVLPEEIPVAFSSFMALGAARMIRSGVLTRQPQTVESLGSATVICTDKTGTITQEGMRLAVVYDVRDGSLTKLPDALTPTGAEVVAYARLASEPEPFDPMEKAITDAWAVLPNKAIATDGPLIYEYPLGGVPPMMTHLYPLGEHTARVAGKGAVERIIRVCKLESAVAEQIKQQAHRLATEGYRVLGVAGAEVVTGAYPAEQDEFDWQFKGLIALENPPKVNARAVLNRFDEAGIQVKMITGDSAETARAIAAQVGMRDAQAVLTGNEVMALTDEALQTQAASVNVFARMYPEAKLRVIRALKAAGEVVAMTGDGVNDGPALKAAHIGVAMGQRGSELAKQSASLILVEDDLSSMVDAIAQGRRIYQNLKQAVGYIVSIHIPIILTVTVPLLLGWKFINLFNPVHVIFLELVMGPTCSIAFENEPAETDLMKQRPRKLSDTFFTSRELGFRVVQGLCIALATLGVYYAQMQAGASLEQVRTMTFATLVISNIWLTLVSRSSRASVLTTLQRPNTLLWIMLLLTALMLAGFLGWPVLRNLGQFTTISLADLGVCAGASFLGVIWVELYKLWLRNQPA
ncbi:cation-translocating P-type ATPase [Rudanella lutea]|uniref:cation-translocating P-type ATPase n=1 Tax=Rudanella lutea TaxID=451374 RepID=UPI00036B8466|nr:cation-translocating P-type ATPase [Rudanella lutea]